MGRMKIGVAAGALLVLAGSPGLMAQSRVAEPQARIVIRSEKEINGDRIVFESENGEVRVRINGREAPEDRIIRKDGRVVVLDEDGGEITSFGTGMGFGPGELRLDFRGDGDPRDLREFDRQLRGGQWREERFPEDPPPVMIGITMSDISDDMREHLGIEDGAGFRVESVIPGLPGEKAGLRAGDIVVGIDGEKSARMADLRDVLKGRRAGDVVRLRVLREGKEKTIRVELAPWEARVMNERFEKELHVGGDEGRLERSIEEAWRSLEMEGVPAEVRRAMERALKELQSQAERVRGLEGRILLFGDDPDQVFRFERGRERDNRDTIRRLEEQLQRQAREMNEELARRGVVDEDRGVDLERQRQEERVRRALEQGQTINDELRNEVRELREEVLELVKERESLTKELSEIKGMLRELMRAKE